MALIELALAAGYCRASPVDPRLPVQVGAAQEFVLGYINRQVYADETAMNEAILDGTAGESPMVVDDATRAATLEYLAALYDNRGPESETRIRGMVQHLRKGMGV